MKWQAVFLALVIPLAAGAQTPNNPLLRRGQAEAVLAGQSTTLDWAEALLQLRLNYINFQVILKELTALPETPELLLVRGRCNFQIEDLRQAYTQSSGPTRWRAAASLAEAEARAGHLPEAMKLLSEAQHGAQQLDESWLTFEVAWAASQIHTLATPNQPDWGGLLLLRQRCRDRQEWFWAARSGLAIFQQLRQDPDWRRTAEYAFGAFEDAEKAGSRLFLWSALQAYGASGLDHKELVLPMMEARATGPGRFAYLSAMAWLGPNLAKLSEETLASAQNDWEVYEAQRVRVRFEATREALESVHNYELAHRQDRTFQSFGTHLTEADYYQRLAGLEQSSARKAELGWQAWQSSQEAAYLVRYSLLLNLERSFSGWGRLQDQFKANLLLFQLTSASPEPARDLVSRFRFQSSGAASLTSNWASVFGPLVRMRFGSQLEDHEQALIRSLDRPEATALARSAAYSQVARYLEFQGPSREVLEAVRGQLAAKPEEAWNHRDLAMELHDLGRHAEAVEQLNEALALDSQGTGYSEAVFLLTLKADSLSCLGEEAAAEACLQKAEECASQKKSGQDWIDAQRLRILRRQKRWQEVAQKLAQPAAEAAPLERFERLLELAEAQLRGKGTAETSFQQAEVLADELGGGAPARLFLEWGPTAAPEVRLRLLDKARKNLELLAALLPEEARPIFRNHPAVAAVLQDRPLVVPEKTGQLEALSREDFLRRSNSLRQRWPELEEALPISVPALVEVQSRLGPQEVFLTFSTLPHQVMLLGCDRQHFWISSFFFDRAQLVEQIQELRQALTRPGGNFQPSALRLYDNLLFPMQKWTAGKDVWIAAHGPLLSLPWSALQDEKGTFVVQRWHSHRLWWGSSDEVRIPPRLDHALLVAAPGKNHLEGVVPEVDSIARCLVSARRLVGPQATRAGLKQALAGTGWLHIAAHSSLNRSSLNDSFVELSDGPLRLSQLYSLKMRPQTTVVLSSCQTAMGQTQPGKDVISLGSGFRLAGAGQVLATLWPVDDEASVEFFRSFYRGLTHNSAVAPAIYAASRQLLKSERFRHPHFLAAYQLEGELFRPERSTRD